MADDHPVVEEEAQPPPSEREWSRPWMNVFLRALSVLPDVTSACRAAGIGRRTAYDMRERQEEFREAWEEALALAADLIQRHAHTWITTGVPVRSTRTVTKRRTNAAGEVIETTTETTESESAERSSTLMIFWLKAWYPDRYRWPERTEVTGAGGGPVEHRDIAQTDAMIASLRAELDEYGTAPETE